VSCRRGGSRWKLFLRSAPLVDAASSAADDYPMGHCLVSHIAAADWLRTVVLARIDQPAGPVRSTDSRLRRPDARRRNCARRVARSWPSLWPQEHRRQLRRVNATKSWAETNFRFGQSAESLANTTGPLRHTATAALPVDQRIEAIPPSSVASGTCHDQHTPVWTASRQGVIEPASLRAAGQ
jgi:hypothetical protein